MQLSTNITAVVHVIQLAVAPVFLLTGIGAILTVDVSAGIATLFIVAMLALIVGLLSFLREIYLATGSIHVTPR